MHGRHRMTSKIEAVDWQNERVWGLLLDRRMERDEFERICLETDLSAIPLDSWSEGVRCYDKRVFGSEFLELDSVKGGPCGRKVEVCDYGIEVRLRKTRFLDRYPSEYTVISVSDWQGDCNNNQLPHNSPLIYGAKKRTSLDLGRKIPFKYIAPAHTFGETSYYPLVPFSSDVFDKSK